MASSTPIPNNNSKIWGWLSQIPSSKYTLDPIPDPIIWSSWAPEGLEQEATSSSQNGHDKGIRRPLQEVDLNMAPDPSKTRSPRKRSPPKPNVLTERRRLTRSTSPKKDIPRDAPGMVEMRNELESVHAPNRSQQLTLRGKTGVDDLIRNAPDLKRVSEHRNQDDGQQAVSPSTSSATPGDGAADTRDSSRTGRAKGSAGRAKSPSKLPQDLAHSDQPVLYLPLDGEAEQKMPPDIRDLAITLQQFGDYPTAFMPRELEGDLKELCGSRLRPQVLDTGNQAYLQGKNAAGLASLRPHHLGDIELQVILEFETLQQIVKDSNKSKTLARSEPAWNARVHDDVLQLAIKGRKDLACENVTTARLIPSCVPRDAAGANITKMVDYAAVLRPPGNSQTMGAIEALVNMQKEDRRTINQSDYYPLKFSPAGIIIETKAPPGNLTEAGHQVGVWIAAFHIRVKDLRPKDRVTSLPVIIVHGHIWRLGFACEIGDKIVGVL